MTILVISFFASARTEFSSSSFYAKGVNTKLLSENVINLVEAQLREGARSTDIVTNASVAWASQPGMIRTYDNTGAPFKYFKLYSWDNMIGTGAFNPTAAADVPPTGATGWASMPNVYTDLNEPVNGIYPVIDPGAQGSVEGFSYTTQTDTSNKLSMPVKWLYVLKNGAVTVATPTGTGTAVKVGGSSATNPVIGRVAFWSDDETCKVNINTASEGIFWDQPYGNSTNEMGIHDNNAVAPFGFADSIPNGNEFARIPGHPATTSLSAIFGYGTNPVLPDTSFDPADASANIWPLTPNVYASNFAPYYSLSPRYEAGGTQGESVQNYPQYFTLPSYRLYDSIDELALDPNRTAVMSPAAASPAPALYPSANGAIPAGRATLSKLTPAIIEQRRFFLSAHSRAPEETLFGTPRISLWPLQDSTQALKVNTAKDNLLAFCSTINQSPYYFQRAGYYQYQANSGQQVLYSPTAIPSALSATEDFPAAPTTTPQTGVPRNENLYAYLQALTGTNIPGFGGNFSAKYPGGKDGNGNLVSDRDEILTEMFDYIRAGVNTFNISPNVLPHYTYTPWSANMADNPYNNPQDTGETIPISIPSNNTHGLGRTYNFDEISLVFFAQSMDLNNGYPKVGNTAAIPATPAGGIDPYNTNRISIGVGLPWAVAIDPGADNFGVLNNTLFGCYTGGNCAGKAFPSYLPPYQPSPAPQIPYPCWLYWDTGNLTTPAHYGCYVFEPKSAVMNATGADMLVAVDPTTNQPQVDSKGNYLPLAKGATGTVVTMGDPQTTGVQAYLLLRPHTVLQGQPVVSPNIRVRVSNLDQLGLLLGTSQVQPLGFPAGSNAVVVFNNNNSASIESSGGILAPFNAVEPYQNAASGDTWNNGAVTAANTTNPNIFFNDGTNPANTNYPLVSAVISTSGATVPFAEYPSPFGGEDTSGIDQTGGPSVIPPYAVNPPAPVQIHTLTPPTTPAPATMALNGTTLKIDVFDSTSDITSTSTKPFETFYVKVPSMTLPIPTIEMANQEGECLGGAGYVGPGVFSNSIVGPRIPGYVDTNTAGNPSKPPYQIPYSVPLGTPPGTPAPLYGTYAVTPLGYPGFVYSNTAYSGGPSVTPGVFQALNYYWQMPWDVRSICQRLSPWWSQYYGRTTIWATSDHLICRGDIVRSFVPNPSPGTIDGDLRLLMANPIRNPVSGASVNTAVDDYIPVGDGRLSGFYFNFPTQGPYDSIYIRQLHALNYQTGSLRTTLDLVPTSQFILSQVSGADAAGNPVGPFGHLQPVNGGMGESSGQLFPNEEYAYYTAPNVTPELQGAFMDSAKQIPGDWTLGQGPMMDGPTVEKPDESIQTPPSSTVFPYYNMGYGPPNTYNLSYSPNREIPSPIVFGTLPSRAMQGIPWCTLLFCPNPASNDNSSVSPAMIHPGFGVSGTPAMAATNLPVYFSPPYSIPPDHLFLDLFWMPVVEPYAISEPFSTAGKVNMNYAIVPFGGYIHRSTALHAVMKSQQLLAVPTTFNNLNFIPMTATDPPDYTNFSGTEPNFKAFGFWYEDSTWGYWGSKYNYITRYGINLPATIDDFASATYTPSSTNGNAFYDRFDVQGDIFRSASEICNVFLVPKPLNLAVGQTLNLSYSPTATAVPTDASYSNMQAWWSNFKMTGDNGREDPYNQLYPRLTTKSNTFDIHMRVQVLTQTAAERASGIFDPAAGDSVTGEYRGSALVERYLDPNQTTLPDFATTFPTNPTGGTSTMDNYVRYRVVGTHAFSP